MKLKQVFVFSLFFLSTLTFGLERQTSFLEPNDLYREDPIYKKSSPVTQADFETMIQRVVKPYEKLAKQHNATLNVLADWQDAEVNAYASQSPDGKEWRLGFFGGMARRPEITSDGFTLVVCHELGHHFGGYPFFEGSWSAVEGEADYFAAQTCARRLWKSQWIENAKVRNKAPLEVRQKCQAAWTSHMDSDLCIRIILAAKSVSNLLAVVRGVDTPSYQTSDPMIRIKTFEEHPEPQCRLDTYMSGAMCHQDFDTKTIPGKNNAAGQASDKAEYEASLSSCMRAEGQTLGVRPRCWFTSAVRMSLVRDKFVFKSILGNGDKVLDPGEDWQVSIPLTTSYQDSLRGAWLHSLIDPELGFSYDPTEALIYESVPFGGVGYPADALKIGIPKDIECGRKVPVQTKISYDDTFDLDQFNLRIGSLILEDSHEVVGTVKIPDGDKKGISSSIVTTSSQGVKTATVEVDISHPSLVDLWIGLMNPAGKIFVLRNRETTGNKTLKIVQELEFPQVSNGTWTLLVKDLDPKDEGTLTRWSVKTYSAHCSR